MKLASLALALALFFAIPGSAQSVSGSLRGVVRDSANARLAHASITIELPGSGQSRSTSSDDRGDFRLDDLKPGVWHVTVQAQNFATANSDVVIAIDTVRNIAVTMTVKSVEQTVGVSAQSSSIATQPIDLTSNVHQAIVTSQDLEQLPLPARSFANIAYLAPGTEHF